MLDLLTAVLLLAAYARLCRWVALRRPGTLADRIRATIADEVPPC